MITALFGLIFRYMPDVRIPWRRFGAFITAVLFSAYSVHLVFPRYSNMLKEHNKVLLRGFVSHKY